MAWMPSISAKTRISYSVIYVIFGVILYLTLGRLLPLPHPIYKNESTLRLTELVVIVSLMGTGLKIDQRFTIKKWAIPLRLVSITMVLSIAVVAALAYFVLGFDPATAILIGAVLAPTDPVLASDVQVGPPHEESTDNVKFSLTAEAGMNDGTAFPFTWLAIALIGTADESRDIQTWIWFDLIYKITIGIVFGFLIGKALAYLIFTVADRVEFIVIKDGFVAVAATLLVYGFTEMVKGYGFIAVFAAAITIRNSELHHKYHKRLHEFTDQVERILIGIVLILFGGSLVTGILDHLTWPMAIGGVLFVLLIRPVTSLIALIGIPIHVKEKLAIGFFGIKGMGSIFYLAFALQEAKFPRVEELWAIVSFVVLLSIIVHGLTATSIMQKLDIEFSRKISAGKRKISQV